MATEAPPIGISPEAAAEHAKRQQEMARPPAEQAPEAPRGGVAATDFVEVPSLWWRLRSFLGAFLGPRVDSDEYRLRMVACSRCPDVDSRHKKYADVLYCGACACPRWWYARITKRNRFRLALCPKGRHPGQNGQPSRSRCCGG